MKVKVLWLLAALTTGFVVPIQVIEELSLGANFMHYGDDGLPHQIFCGKHGFYRNMFVERNGKPRYMPVRVNGSIPVYRDNRFLFLRCAGS